MRLIGRLLLALVSISAFLILLWAIANDQQKNQLNECGTMRRDTPPAMPEPRMLVEGAGAGRGSVSSPPVTSVA